MMATTKPSCHNRLKSLNSFSVSLVGSVTVSNPSGRWRMTDMGGMVVERDRMVPARDGGMLATDVYRPDGPGPFAVLLERTPYDKSAPSRSERTAAVGRPRCRPEDAAFFVAHGGAVADQDCLGV